MDIHCRWSKQCRFYYVFFRSTLKVSIFISLPLAMLGGVIANTGGLVGFLKIWLLQIPVIGLGFDFLYKELSQKETYLPVSGSFFASSIEDYGGG